ncbi:olfactory receptor 4K13-like [Onychostoma macrolepis]|uniref:olfactory receptor 4K13-like n=1 Tax=Onychostoma macrolepis TaxID=369639 RepID=UPI00272B4435|nr:olfactory receptor 4K13-like [Onychostoma macrolepis]
MLQSATHNISFTLDAYNKIHDLKYVFVVVLGLLYPVIIIANGLIICIVCLERKLHKPMYLFICNLACINLYGGTAVSPFIITRFLTEDYQITCRFDMRHMPYIIRVILSLYFLILSPLINPVLYGLRTQAIKETIKIKLCPMFYQRQTVVRCVT